jgi:hypothetical protein
MKSLKKNNVFLKNLNSHKIMVRHQWQRHPKAFLARSMAITSFLFDHDLSIIPGGWSLYFSAVDGTFLSNLIVYCLTRSSCTEVNDRISRHKFGFFFQAPCQTSCTLAARQHNFWLFFLKDGVVDNAMMGEDT